MKHVLAVLTVLACLLGPTAASAEPVTYTAPYQLGPSGGDASNRIIVNAQTGEVAVIRHQLVGLNGSLGCGGQGGWGYLAITHDAVEPVSAVTVSWRDAAVDPYTFINVGVRKGDGYLSSSSVSGILLGTGSTTVRFPATTGQLVVWFGIQVSSACPNIDGGRAIFSSVTVG